MFFNARSVPIRLVFLSILLGVQADVLPQETPAPVPTRVKGVLAAHEIPLDSTSLYVHEVGQAKPLLEHQADTPRHPASTIKLLTTFVALDVFGPAHSWPTEAYIEGELTDGQLEGDLVIKGYGDPFFVTERFWSFLREMRRKGLKDISGDLLIDSSHFAPEMIDPAAFDGRPYRTYNVQPDALLINFKTVRFTFVPNPQNGSVLVTTDPELANLSVANRLRLVDGTCTGYQRGISVSVQNGGLGGEVGFSGRFPSRCRSYSMSRAVLEPTTYAYGLFRSLWTEMGGSLEGRLKGGVAPDYDEPFHIMQSRPLGELLRSINKFSSNVMTRQLVLSLGVEAFGPPGTHEDGKAAIHRWLETQGLDLGELVLDNGAGLSRDTRISAKSMGQILLKAYTSPYMPEFVSSLPLAGLDGTLRNRFVGEPAAGRLHIKTGRLDHVYAMAGYVLSRTGRTFVVVAMSNYPNVHRGPGAEAQDALLRWVYAQ